ncbi:MAG: hypothetical protein RLZZ297_2019 [Chloroflexota bacterium]|jgi:GT2 family glycosyltransferase
MSTPRVSIIVVTYQSAAVLPAFAAAYAADPASAGHELICVDNASNDTPQGYMPQAHWISNPTNVGYGTACNRGAAAATGDYVIFCNPDILVTPDWVAPLIAHMAADPTIGAISPETRYPHEHRLPQAGCSDRATLPGAALLLPRALWQRLGGFDEELFLYWEDTDLCWRIQLLGLRTVVAHDSVIVHQRNGSGGGSATWLHLYVQNGIYAHLKTQPWWRIIAFVARQLVALPWRLLRTGDRRLLTAFGWNLDRFGATLRHRRTLLGRK